MIEEGNFDQPKGRDSMEPVNAQIYSFLGTVVTGLVLGLLFDFYRVFRMIIRPKKFFSCLGDLLFGLLPWPLP